MFGIGLPELAVILAVTFLIAVAVNLPAIGRFFSRLAVGIGKLITK